MSSIYLVRCDDGWLYVDGESSGFRPSMTGAMVYGDRLTAAQTAAMLHAEPVEFREDRGHEQAFNHALDCVDRVFQVGGQPEPPLLPDFCQLNEDKFLAVIRLAEEFTKQQQALAAARNEVEKLSRKLKAAEK